MNDNLDPDYMDEYEPGEEVECFACGGDGRCAHCMGGGDHNCPHCDQVMNCKECDGTGDCPACGGRGVENL